MGTRPKASPTTMVANAVDTYGQQLLGTLRAQVPGIAGNVLLNAGLISPIAATSTTTVVTVTTPTTGTTVIPANVSPVTTALCVQRSPVVVVKKTPTGNTFYLASRFTNGCFKKWENFLTARCQ